MYIKLALMNCCSFLLVALSAYLYKCIPAEKNQLLSVSHLCSFPLCHLTVGAVLLLAFQIRISNLLHCWSCPFFCSVNRSYFCPERMHLFRMDYRNQVSPVDHFERMNPFERLIGSSQPSNQKTNAARRKSSVSVNKGTCK